MKPHRASITSTFIFINVFFISATAALAAESGDKTLTVQASQMESLSSTPGESVVSGKISSDFSSFAGSAANSDALVTGLRNGTEITLITTHPHGRTTATTFTPATGKLGYGNVFISLALAKQQLASLGITRPTAHQLEASLVGGTITTRNGKLITLTGVSQMRSQGMGWGQIANSLGFKLGPVISGIKAANYHVAAQGLVKTAGATPVTTAGGNASARSGTGIVTAAGGHVSASGASTLNHGNAYGRGIVTGTGAAGGHVSASGANALNHGNAYGRGIVTGTGAAGGYASVSGANASGMNHGNAYGRGIVTGTGAAGAAQANAGAASNGKAVGR